MTTRSIFCSAMYAAAVQPATSPGSISLMNADGEPASSPVGSETDSPVRASP